MKRNTLMLAIILILTVGLMNCSKKDTDPTDTPSNNSTCNEMPPDNELCLAHFTRWFYNKENNTCEEIGYSGCSQKGFETKVECEECDCR